MAGSDEVLKTQEIWVNKFDEESAREFRKAVMSIAKCDPTRPIVVYIDSYGGSVDSLATMIETMDEVPNTIITACIGKAMSCGAILLSHGDVRFCGKHSRIMIHEVSSVSYGNVHDMDADVVETKRMNRYFMGLLAKNCGLSSYEELRNILKRHDGREIFMGPKEALEFGIVDAVGLPNISTTLTYDVGITLDKKNKTTVKEKQPPKRSRRKPASKSESRRLSKK